jgi:hypothetical protein
VFGVVEKVGYKNAHVTRGTTGRAKAVPLSQVHPWPPEHREPNATTNVRRK